MKHKFLLKSMLLLCALIAGSSSVWAAVTFKKITSISEVSEGSSYLFVYVNGNSGMVQFIEF